MCVCGGGGGGGLMGERKQGVCLLPPPPPPGATGETYHSASGAWRGTLYSTFSRRHMYRHAISYFACNSKYSFAKNRIREQLSYPNHENSI